MRTVFVALLILAFPRWSTAEINMADSIEWMTADSDSVVVAKVAKVTERNELGQTWYRVAFAVSSTLKGKVMKTVDVTVRQVSGDSPAKWKADKAELLLFLIDGKRRAIHECRNDTACSNKYTSAPFAVRAGTWGDGGVYKLDGSARAYTMTHDVISKRADLIANTKGASASKASKAFRMDLPLNSPAGRRLWGGSAVFLYVPIDAALEQHAIQWIGSSDPNARDQGVEALAHFQSKENASRLENLLTDTATHDTNEGDNPTVRRFFVRKRAHETLRAWGVAHTTPLIDTPLPKTP